MPIDEVDSFSLDRLGFCAEIGSRHLGSMGIHTELGVIFYGVDDWPV
jgi:hypothetical protein